MRGIKTILMIPVAAVLLLAGACTGNSYDNNGGPQVVLEIISFTTPPVTAAVSTTGFCSTSTAIGCTVDTDCPSLEACIIGGCTLTVVDWSVAFANVPKNSLSAGPANDIMMNAVDIFYTFPAGSPLPLRVHDQFYRCLGVRVGQIYGATEFGTVTYGDPERPGFESGSVGDPLSGVSLRIVARSEDGVGISEAECVEGEVWVRAPSMMDGYLDADAGFDEHGYLGTGDIGRVSPAGVLTLTGRLKLLIDVGGQKVNPMEVEAVLARFPGVAEAVVIPVPYSDTAQRLMAVVVPQPGATPDSEALRDFARQHLSPHKVPRRIEVRSDVPRSATGKLQRGKLERAAFGASGAAATGVH